MDLTTISQRYQISITSISTQIHINIATSRGTSHGTSRGTSHRTSRGTSKGIFITKSSEIFLWKTSNENRPFFDVHTYWPMVFIAQICRDVPGRPPANSSRSSSRSSRRKKFRDPQLLENRRAQLRLARTHARHETRKPKIDFPVGVPSGLTPPTSNIYYLGI